MNNFERLPDPPQVIVISVDPHHWTPKEVANYASKVFLNSDDDDFSCIEDAIYYVLDAEVPDCQVESMYKELFGLEAKGEREDILEAMVPEIYKRW